MLLGTYHMDNPGLDEINVAADDVLALKRQEELQTLMTQLASWQPERIAVERPYDSADAVNTLYDEYRTGERSYNREKTIDPPHSSWNNSTIECRSEIVQIGFRLADTLDHERIYPIDHPIDISNDDFEELDARGFQPEDKVPFSLRDSEAIEQELNDRLVNSTIPEYLRWMNQEDQLRVNHRRMFGRYLRWGEGDNYGGPRTLALWYDRNLRMAHNLWRALERGDERLLLIVGSGHVHVLRQLLTEAPMFCPVSPLPYL
jgi:hypothetical protein